MMSRDKRCGNRIKRENKKTYKIPELGYYVIVTDTNCTERLYFSGLLNSLPEDSKNKIVIKVIETRTKNLINKSLESIAYDSQYRIPWIVFDRDRVQGFDNIIYEASKQGINVGWSNPCFEIWLHAYYGSMPNITESWKCCSSFKDLFLKKTKLIYSKSDDEIYKKIYKTGDEKNAKKIADSKLKEHVRDNKTKPSEMCPGTTVHILINEISSKCNK